jgi:urea ABC transporter ATP-binding protein UrtE
MPASATSTLDDMKGLLVRDVWAGYGQTVVLQGVTLVVRPSEVVALLGRNGVGKTTLLKTIMGILRPRAGEILLDTAPITGLMPHKIAVRGVAYVPQGRGIFPKLTVRENLLLGTKGRCDGERIIPESIYDYFPVLRERLNQLGGTLSGGEQQMLAIARALAAEPAILLLDEPSEGIQPSIVIRLADILQRIHQERDISILLVEQNLDLALSIADRCLIMEKGRIVYEGIPNELKVSNVIQRFLVI